MNKRKEENKRNKKGRTEVFQFRKQEEFKQTVKETEK